MSRQLTVCTVTFTVADKTSTDALLHMHEDTTTGPQHLSFWSEFVPWGFCSQIIQNLRQLLTNKLYTAGHQQEGPLACSCIPQCCICTGDHSHHLHRIAAMNPIAVSYKPARLHILGVRPFCGNVQVSGVNYQAYAFDGTNGSPSSEQDVTNDITRGSTGALTEFGAAQGQKLVFGVAPNRPGPSSNPPFATNCAALGRIVDVVCPALKNGNNDQDLVSHWATGIMVFDFDTEWRFYSCQCCLPSPQRQVRQHSEVLDLQT